MKAAQIVLLIIILTQASFAQTGWFSQNSGTTFPLSSIYFPSLNTGYTVGELNVILKTTDAGQNWNALNSGIFAFFYGVYFTTEDIGYVVGYDGRIRKTTNGGLNWIDQSYNTLSDFYSVQFINEDTGFVVGDFLILKTTNGGLNWIANSDYSNLYFKNVQFVNSTTGYISAIYGEILKTTNCGESWFIVNNMNSGLEIRSLFFLNADTGYVGGYDFNYLLLRRTYNGGQTWSTINTNTISTANAIKFVNFNTGFICANNGIVLKTTNAGINWQNSNISNDGLYSIYFVDSLIGFICGSSGRIFKTTDGGIVTNINNHIENVSFTLSQNYPNPFNPVTNLEFGISKSEFVSLKVYNALGVEVKVLVNEKRLPGRYSITFDGSNFPSGVYFYILKAGDTFQTRRMILVK